MQYFYTKDNDLERVERAQRESRERESRKREWGRERLERESRESRERGGDRERVQREQNTVGRERGGGFILSAVRKLLTGTQCNVFLFFFRKTKSLKENKVHFPTVIMSKFFFQT